MFLLLALCSLVLRAVAAPLVSARVDAPSGRACDVHLHASPDARGLPQAAGREHAGVPGDQLVLMNRALPAVTLLHQGDGVFVFHHEPATELTFTARPRRLTIRKDGVVLPMRRAGPPKARHARRVEGVLPPGPAWSTMPREPAPPPAADAGVSAAPMPATSVP